MTNIVETCYERWHFPIITFNAAEFYLLIMWGYKIDFLHGNIPPLIFVS